MAITGKNYQFNQSLNGLNTTTLFTSPAAGIYFINGQLQFPNAGQNVSSASLVQAVVKKNTSTTVYTGVAGAGSFQIPQLTLALGDVISVVLSSSNGAVDNGLNVVAGTVAAGNAF